MAGKSGQGLSIIVPASNEAGVIGRLLDSLLASRCAAGTGQVDVIVVANGCADETAAAARRYEAAAVAKGWRLRVIELTRGDKLNALNAGDAAAIFANRAYLDADIVVSPGLVGELAEALDRPEPVYASGTLKIAKAQSAITRHYARFWSKLPFVADGVPGCGLFAVNGPGRARWERFPDIISDDTFVRLQFADHERVVVPSAYEWPMVEGFANLVRVRRRQNIGVREVENLAPAGVTSTGGTRPTLARVIRLAASDLPGMVVYSAVALAVHLPGRGTEPRWARGR